MTRVTALTLVLVLGCFAVGIAGFSPTPQDTGALDHFLEALKECLFAGPYEPHGTGVDFKIPPGKYCLYYVHPHGEEFGYDFGYFESDPKATFCGPLHRLLEGRHGDCYYEKGYESSLLPPDPALLVEISTKDREADLWINGDWEWGYPAGPPGFHTSVRNLNWDSQYHAYCYRVDFEEAHCECRCLKNATGTVDTRPTVGYLIFWDAGCPLSDWDWDDFWVALIPAK